MLSENTKAPDFTLCDKDGKTYSLSDFAGRKLVLYFYPRDNTPGCTRQACAFAAAYNDFRTMDVQVVGISKDSAASHAKFAEKYDLPFILLSDPELSAIKAYDVWQEKKNYGKVSMGVVRTTYVIDENGIIIKTMPKVKPDTNAAEIKIIAHIENDFTEKFGIPRQSGLADVPSRIVFEPEYRAAEAFRGLEGFSHLWILWLFSEAMGKKWSPTVRPPRLGGNTRMGVFATRSPFRPNSIGLSSVKITGIDLNSPDGPVITVTGADIMNGTPIIDIKPYLAYTDSHPEALSGFALTDRSDILTVDFPPELLEKVPEEKRHGLIKILAQDPRPSYQNSPEKEYAMSFGGFDVSFTVDGSELYVKGITVISR
mgnify:CR=1 FL=1